MRPRASIIGTQPGVRQPTPEYKLQSKQLLLDVMFVLIRERKVSSSSVVLRLLPEAIYKSKDKELMRSGPTGRGWPLIDDKKARAKKLFRFATTLIIVN